MGNAAIHIVTFANNVLQHSPNQGVNDLRLLLQGDHGFLGPPCQVLSQPLQFSCQKDHALCNNNLNTLAFYNRLGVSTSNQYVCNGITQH